MTVTMIIIAILVTLGGVYHVTLLERTRRGRAYEDAMSLYNANFGTRDFNGFVADVGRLSTPANGANELVVSIPAGVSQTNLNTSGRAQWIKRGVSAGWRGPYSAYSPTGFTNDPWSRPWVIDATGRITSLGQDGVLGTSDDISVPPKSTSTVLRNGANDAAIAVFVESPDDRTVLGNGQATVQVGNVDGAGNFVLVTATPPTASTPYFLASGLVPGRHVIIAAGAGATGLSAARATTIAWAGGGSTSVRRVTLRRDCCQGL